MRTIGTVLAALCAALVVATGVMALFFFNIERRAFSPEPYKRAFDKLGLYDRMPSILAASLFGSPASLDGTENPVWALLSTEGVESGLAFLLPPTELKTMTDGSLDSIFAYINGEADSASIPLRPFKDHLAGPAGTEAVLNLLGTQPSCTVEQIFQMTVGALSGGKFFLCNPPPEALELFKPLIQSQLQFTVSIIPDAIVIIPGDRNGTENDPRLRLNRIRAWMQISPFLPFMLLLAIIILVARNLQTFFNWWGYPILASGLIALVLALLGAPIIGAIIKFLLETQAVQFASPIMIETLRDTTQAVAREMLAPIALQGIILALVGFVMVVAGFLFHRRAQRSPS